MGAPCVVPILLPHPISFPTLPISFPDVNRTRALLIESAGHCEIMTCFFTKFVLQYDVALSIESAARLQCTCTFDRKCSKVAVHLHFRSKVQFTF